MFWGEKSQIFIFQKNEKPQSIYRTAIYTENQIRDFRKDPPQLLLMYIFKTQNLKPSFYS